MSIRIDCPSCETPNTVDDAKRGGKVRCRKCKEPIIVPTGKKQAPSGGFPVLLIAGGAAALLLFVLMTAAGIGAYFWYRSQSTAPEPQAAITEKKADDKPRIEKPEPKEEKPETKIEPKKPPEPTPGPESLSLELQKVAQATVHVAALTSQGKLLEGSGFFTVEPGFIITNAHVLGMLDPNSLPPIKVEAIINGGDVSETKLRCTILAVDRDNDLAALRVQAASLPAPLTFEDSSKLAVAQNVHISGFPLGRQERKDVTINSTDITNLKKNAGSGTLDEIQVNGGMKPGSSGGPVVTPAGNVVGVALGAVRDTSMHLAIPTDVVKRFLDGRVGAGTFDKPFQVAKDMKVPVTYPLIDPLKRIKDVKVEVWAGMPGEPRPYSYKQPAPLPGDGKRVAQPLTNQNSYASNDITLPASVPTGQVVWMQPIITLADNSTQWGVATSMPLPAASPYDRKPANLTVKLQSPALRTVKLKYTLTKNIGGTSKVEIDILEIMGPDPDGASMKTGFGTLNGFLDDAQKIPMDRPTLDLVRQIPTAYVVDTTNRVTRRTFRMLDPKTPKEMRDPVLTQLFQIGAAYEAGIVPMPNKTVQPGETWKINVPAFIRSKQKMAEAVLVLDGTYQGFLKRDKVNEAIITVAGKLQTRNTAFKDFEADVTGTIGFNEVSGYISSTQFKLTNSSDKTAYTLDINLARSSGNPNNIKLPQDMKVTDPPPIVVKGKVLLDKKKESLTAKDPADPGFSDVKNPKSKKLAHYKEYTVILEPGKAYQIDLKSGAFDPYIKVQAPTGMLIAQNGAPGNARVQFRATVAGQYRIYAIGRNHRTGSFHLTVTENP